MSYEPATANPALATGRCCRQRVAGFTLIELMVTLAIGVLLMVVAAPSFVQVRKNGQLADSVNSLVMAANAAKSAALKTGRDSYIVVNDSTAGWRSGWMVFTDNNWNQQYDAGMDDVLLTREALDGTIAVTTPSLPFSEGYLRFNGAGYPRLKSGSASDSRLVMANDSRSSTIVVSVTGRVRSCKTGDAGC